jgi:hypothetical protein
MLFSSNVKETLTTNLGSLLPNIFLCFLFGKAFKNYNLPSLVMW